MRCHTAFDRAAQVARHWALQGCPVVIHVDRRVKRKTCEGLVKALADLDNIRFSGRHACEWGTGASLPPRRKPARSCCVISRRCGMSIWPLALACLCARLRNGGLSGRTRTGSSDRTTEDVGWTIGGLDVERFTCAFRSGKRRLFDGMSACNAATRRRIGGHRAAFGYQWWCLTRRRFPQAG